MKNSFWNELEQLNNITVTTNGDKSYKSSLSGLCDLMFKGPNEKDKMMIVENYRMFLEAFYESPVDAIRLLFYIRDCRGGQGTKAFFRNVMLCLSCYKPEIACQIIKYIPEYGSWDDVIYLFKNRDKMHFSSQNTIFTMICEQIAEDSKNIMDNKSCSLLFKWMPSENTSSAETVRAAKEMRKLLKMNSHDYRVMLSAGRKYVDIVERKLCAKKYEYIDYKTVPAKAMLKYRNAFMRNDEKHFNKYLADLEAGKTKINAGTLYPFDLVNKLTDMSGFSVNPNLSDADIKVIENQWKALPNFFDNKSDNSIVVADVSGSMTGNPIKVCLSLALYIAERNKGIFHNKFITFSANPSLENLRGNNLRERLMNLTRAEWDMNTNIDAVFQLLYNAVTPETIKDMPSSIYIISDMQFDSCCTGGKSTVFEKWQKKFKTELKIDLPKVIFWNVSEYGCNTMPITIHNTGAMLVSGFSPAIIKFIMNNDVIDTLGLIKSITESERYNNIVIEI